MRMFDRVAIACDHTFTEDATALRSVLEAFRLKVDYHRFVQSRQVSEFFAAQRDAVYTVLYCHGHGFTAEDMRITFEVVAQENNDTTAPTGWSNKSFDLKPTNIPDITSDAKGTLLSLACGSGRPDFARAFLSAGYEAYIGPTEEYWDSTAALTFAVGFFYHLLSNDRDYDGRNYTTRQSAERAASIDPDFEMGMRMMRYYDKSDFPDL